MITRYAVIGFALLLGTAPALADPQATVAAPSLKESATITGEIVRIGDLVDNAGVAAQIAIYRAPDLGTTGSLRTSQLLDVLRANQVVGVDTHGIREVSITRTSRALSAKDLEYQVAKALERRNGLGEAANLALTFDRDLRDIQLEPSNTGDLVPVSVRYDSRSNRFDVVFDIANDASNTPTKLRFTGLAVDTVEAAVLVRALDRGEIIRASDISYERRPKAELANDAAPRDRVIGMQARRALRAGQGLKSADLAKPDMVTRDQMITLIYESPGLYLTGRGKAVDGGTQGDTVNVINLQSKRTVQGVVVGPGQVAVSAPTPLMPSATLAAAAPSATGNPE